jgi:hypothetical protein
LLLRKDLSGEEYDMGEVDLLIVYYHYYHNISRLAPAELNDGYFLRRVGRSGGGGRVMREGGGVIELSE